MDRIGVFRSVRVVRTAVGVCRGRCGCTRLRECRAGAGVGVGFVLLPSGEPTVRAIQGAAGAPGAPEGLQPPAPGGGPPPLLLPLPPPPPLPRGCSLGEVWVRGTDPGAKHRPEWSGDPRISAVYTVSAYIPLHIPLPLMHLQVCRIGIRLFSCTIAAYIYVP